MCIRWESLRREAQSDALPADSITTEDSRCWSACVFQGCGEAMSDSLPAEFAGGKGVEVGPVEGWWWWWGEWYAVCVCNWLLWWPWGHTEGSHGVGGGGIEWGGMVGCNGVGGWGYRVGRDGWV